MNDTMNFARENGYVCTLMGRRRYLRDINSANATVRGFAERNAINAPIQGSAADMIKIAMINIHRELKAQNLDARMTMQVHDELVFDVPRNEIEMVKPIIMENMKNAIKTDGAYYGGDRNRVKLAGSTLMSASDRLAANRFKEDLNACRVWSFKMFIVL